MIQKQNLKRMEKQNEEVNQIVINKEMSFVEESTDPESVERIKEFLKELGVWN